MLIQDKVPLVIFSGGLDSTRVLDHALGLYENVDVLTIELIGQINKISREKKAVTKILDIFRSKRELSPTTYGKVRNYDTSRVNGYRPVDGGMALNQAPGWLAEALHHCRRDTSEVMMGYVKGDDQSLLFSDMRMAWEHLLNTCGQNLTTSIRPILTSPFLFWSKEEILTIPGMEAFAHVSWCESLDTGTDCGQCKSCHRMMAALNNWKLIHPASYDRDCNLKPRFTTMMKKWRAYMKQQLADAACEQLDKDN